MGIDDEYQDPEELAEKMKRNAHEYRTKQFEKGKIKPGSDDEQNLKHSLEQAERGEFKPKRGPKSVKSDRKN